MSMAFPKLHFNRSVASGSNIEIRTASSLADCFQARY